MRKGLLSSTALVGVSLLGAPAMAATPSVSDNFSVTIAGNLRITFIAYTQDQDDVTTSDDGKGHWLAADESEIAIRARGVADNGLSYGFDVEIMTQTNDENNSDETWMFIDGAFGRIELGDQDDAPDRMMIDGADAQAGRGGNNFNVGTGDMIMRTGINAVDSASITRSGDATKAIYFTKRYSGFQGGFSWTPDTDQDGGEDASDGNGFQDVLGFGLNYQNTFNGVGVTIGGVYHTGHDANPANEDLEIFGGGVLVRYAGFQFGAGYANHNNTGISSANEALGQDAGQWWNVGLEYDTGPWGFSVGYYSGWAENVTGVDDTTHQQVAVSAEYDVAPGWVIAGDIIHFDFENRGRSEGDDADGWLFVVSSTMSF